MKKHAVDSGLINEYIHEVAGDIFSAKDFRIWRVTCSFFDTIVQLPLTDEQKERHANVLTGYHTAATALGNTSTFVCEYYIHPQVVSVYEDGNFVPYYKKATLYKPKNSLDSRE